MTASRRQQRDIYKKANFIRIKNALPRFSDMAKEWYESRRKEGNEKANRFMLDSLDRLENHRAERFNFAKQVWLDWGYNDAEIKLLEESWSLALDPQNRQDRKKARELSKQAWVLRNDRFVKKG